MAAQLTQQQLAEITAWVDTYADRSDLLAAQTTQQILALYAAPEAWAPAGQAAVAQQASVISDTATAVAAGMTAQYLSHAITATIGAAVPLPNLPVPVIRNGTPMQAVFERVSKAYQRHIAGGVTPIEALIRAFRLMQTLVDSNVRFAEQHAAQQTLTYLAARSDVTGYRRVVHPELSRTGACGLCIVASDAIYHVADLMPLHANCKCTVLPIVNGIDPGNSLNNLSLGDVYGAAADRPNAIIGSGTNASDLKKVRYAVAEHGEYGPTLVNADHHFTRLDGGDAKQRGIGSTTPRRRGVSPTPVPSVADIEAAQAKIRAQLAETIQGLNALMSAA